MSQIYIIRKEKKNIPNDIKTYSNKLSTRPLRMSTLTNFGSKIFSWLAKFINSTGHPLYAIYPDQYLFKDFFLCWTTFICFYSSICCLHLQVGPATMEGQTKNKTNTDTMPSLNVSKQTSESVATPKTGFKTTDVELKPGTVSKLRTVRPVVTDSKVDATTIATKRGKRWTKGNTSGTSSVSYFRADWPSRLVSPSQDILSSLSTYSPLETP